MDKKMAKDKFNGKMEINIKVNSKMINITVKVLKLLKMVISIKVNFTKDKCMDKEY
jgi:hypothetical protein